MPNFLIIGAERAGSTSLYHYLKQHPQIYMSPIKEPRFFAYENTTPHYHGPHDQKKLPKVTTLEAYRALFAGVTNERAIGEASVIYLYSQKAPQRIRHHIPNAKLIAILRNPVDRAYSRFWANLVVQKHEPLTSFAQAIQAEEKRIQDNWHPRWHYKQRGLYYAQLKRYLDIFDRDQIHICLCEDMATDPLNLLQDVFRFLDVNDVFEPKEQSQYHKSIGSPKHTGWYRFLTKPHPIKTILRPLLPAQTREQIVQGLKERSVTPRPPVPAEIRAALIKEYRKDILHLEDLIQRDLSTWLK
jgi:hypothetical protein